MDSHGTDLNKDIMPVVIYGDDQMSRKDKVLLAVCCSRILINASGNNANSIHRVLFDEFG